MNEAVQHESLQVAIDCRFGRSEFTRELGNPKWFLGARKALQQAQREVDGSGRRPRLFPMNSCNFGHVSIYETMFHITLLPNARGVNATIAVAARHPATCSSDPRFFAARAPARPLLRTWLISAPECAVPARSNHSVGCYKLMSTRAKSAVNCYRAGSEQSQERSVQPCPSTTSAAL